MKKFKTRYISYADGNYSAWQQHMVDHIKKNKIFDSVATYNRDWLVTTDFYKDNQKILDMKRGAGYWLWKPYIILENLKQLSDNEILVYMDVGDRPEPGFYNFLESWFLEKDILLTEGGNNSRRMCKRDALILMGCDEEKYWDAPQVEAGFIALRKTDFNMKFVELWLELCKDERILTDLPNICGKENFPDFIEHRHDQSVLSLLKTRFNINTTNDFARSDKPRFVFWNVNEPKNSIKPGISMLGAARKLN